VRTLLRWLVITLGIAALVRWLRHRRQTPAAAELGTLEDPAEELRQKLAESRVLQQEEATPEPGATVEERRSEIHAQGKAALSEMTSSDEG
jgi:hypothetical protein